MRALSLAEANKIIHGTFASARRRKAYPLAAIVLDAGGRVKAFQKQDGASLMRFEIAYGKAFGALALNRSSRQVLQKAKEKPAFMASLTELSDGPLFLEGGGQLVRDETGEVVGALGVTGDVNEVDDLCAMDGIRGAGFRNDDDFDAQAVKRLNIKKDPPIRDPRKELPAAAKPKKKANGGTPAKSLVAGVPSRRALHAGSRPKSEARASPRRPAR
jgi:uncharacterized protein GlcG (DUF336 family)